MTSPTKNAEALDEKEIWVPVYGYHGKYEVSDKGRVKSLKRSKETILTPTYGNGYARVCLSGEKTRTVKVHRVVAESFFGYQDRQVNHIDGNRANNVLENLEYVSNRENMNHHKSKNRDLPSGVSRCWRKFKVRIKTHGKTKFFYGFKTPKEASDFYLSEVQKLGEAKYAKQ